jgi:hypothetical protein
MVDDKVVRKQGERGIDLSSCNDCGWGELR